MTGSANASRSAWLTADAGGNAEMVVVHVEGDNMWRVLGLEGFASLPEVGTDVWQALKVRKDAAVEEISGRSAALFHAVLVPEGFEVDAEFIAGDAMSRVEALAGNVVLGDLLLQRRVVGRVVLGSDDPTVLDAASLLRVSPADAIFRYAIVTRVDELRGKAAGSAQQKFRMALSGLQGDPEQLANLFRLVQKALFEQEPLLQAASPSAGHPPPTPPDEGEVEGPERVLKSLKMSPAELIKQRHHRRVAPSSEIASIIDALIYQLGIRSAAEAPPPAPENEEPEAAPEPEKPDDPKEPTGAERASQCRSKVNSLFSRMTTQLEAAEGVGRNVTVAIVQLAAVLGIVKYLRLGIVDWLPKNDRLVDAVKARKFFTQRMPEPLRSDSRPCGPRPCREQRPSIRRAHECASPARMAGARLRRQCRDAPARPEGRAGQCWRASAGRRLLASRGHRVRAGLACRGALDAHACRAAVRGRKGRASPDLGKSCPCGRVYFQHSGVRSIQTRRHRGVLQSEVSETIRGVASAAWQDRCPRPRSARPQALRGRLAGPDRTSASRHKRRASPGAGNGMIRLM